MTGRGLFRLLAFLLVTYAMTVAGMYMGQRQIMYRPPAVALPPPPSGVEPVTLTTEDGLALTAWHAAARDGRPTLVYFHGNGSLIAGLPRALERLVAAGYGLLLAEYRGYGGNPGSPSETGLIADGRAALRYLESRGVGDEATVLVGESLGTGVAVALAAEQPVAGLILLAPFTSAADIAQQRYWWLPARWLIKDPFDSLARIGQVQAPLLLVHGERDRVIPFTFGERLFEAANEPKTLARIATAGHSDLYRHGLIPLKLTFLEGLAD